MKFSRVTITAPEKDRFGRASSDPKVITQDAGPCAHGRKSHEWSGIIHEDQTGRFFWADYERCLAEQKGGPAATEGPCQMVRLRRGKKVIGYTRDPILISSKDMSRVLIKAVERGRRPSLSRDLRKKL